MSLAAGILPYCPKTGRYLIAKRGANISNPNQWTNFGGKANKGENPAQTAVREFKEESGYKGSVRLNRPIPTKNNKDGITFYNFIGEVPAEFQPTTIGKKTVDGDVEVSASKWVTKEQLMGLIGNSILHPGFNRFLNLKFNVKENMNSSIKRLIEQIDHDNIEEDNVSSNIPPVDTPYAFGKKVKDPDDVSYSEPVEATERFFKKMQETIAELNYKDFKKDDTKNEKQKINNSILEINKKLREVEQMVNHAARLKIETGQDESVFWKGTARSFVKIKERLNRLTNKIVEVTG